MKNIGRGLPIILAMFALVSALSAAIMGLILIGTQYPVIVLPIGFVSMILIMSWFVGRDS